MSIESYPSPNGVLTSLIWRKTAAGGETSLSGYDNASQALSYTPGQEQVYLNGILLVRGSDYTATNGTSITNLVALAEDDFVQVNCYNNFSVASVPGSSITGEIPSVQTQLDAKIPKTLTTTTGDIIYASSANTPARLGIGSTNQVLTVSGGIPAWSTPAASGAFTLLSTTNITASASVEVSGISGLYKHLYIEVNGAYKSSSSGDFIGFKLNDTVAGSSTMFTNGQSQSPYVSGRYQSLPEIQQYTTDSANASKNFFSVWIYDYTNTTHWKNAVANAVWKANNGGSVVNNSICVYEVTDAITSFKLTTNGGDLQNAGTIKVYGVN